jgi:hypothetical protein
MLQRPARQFISRGINNMLMKLKDAAAFAAVTVLVCVYAGGCSSNTTKVQAAGGGPAAAGGQVAGNPSAFEPVFKTRGPRTCNSVTSVPTVAQIPALVQCTLESKTAYAITLITNIKVQTGGFRAYSEFQDGYATGIDTSAKVMPIRGSMVQWLCSQDRDDPGANCARANKPQAEGECWKTTFGDWKCSMLDLKHDDTESHLAPPTEQ